MELKLIETELVCNKLFEEMQWIDARISNAPEGLKEELQALSGGRKAAYESIANVISNAMITIPSEAEALASGYANTDAIL